MSARPAPDFYAPQFWQGMDDQAAAGAQELYLELVSYGLDL